LCERLPIFRAERVNLIRYEMLVRNNEVSLRLSAAASSPMQIISPTTRLPNTITPLHLQNPNFISEIGVHAVRVHNVE
jgi:hypothetical protein